MSSTGALLDDNGRGPVTEYIRNSLYLNAIRRIVKE